MARMGAVGGGGSDAQITAVGELFEALGLAFQIMDDILDLTGQQEELGKPLGMDVLESKANLPLMLAMQDRHPCSGRIREIYSKEDKTAQEAAEVLALVRETDALAISRSHAEKFRDAALAALDTIPPSVYRTSLVTLAGNILDRSS
jgi:octaprenyl-diphosphate synthase